MTLGRTWDLCFVSFGPALVSVVVWQAHGRSAGIAALLALQIVLTAVRLERKEQGA